MAKLRRHEFSFHRHDTVGTAGAEEDEEFLLDCFVDTGDLETLRDMRKPHRIVVGRTGVGKTAHLLHLAQTEEHVSAIAPEKLALDHLANSTVLRRLEELGVDLDIFYRLLWRHVFAIELIRLKYDVRTEKDQKRFLERLAEQFRSDKTKEEALKYLEEWGQHFWEDAEYRIHEVTRTLETDARAAAGANASIFEAEASLGERQTQEEKAELVHRLQAVVNTVQIRKLGKVIDLLAKEVFKDPQERYFVTIDRLDERWVNDALRYRLVRALIETARDLQRIQNAKIVVALRRDLLERVIRETRDPGFQEENFRSLILRLYWRKKQLMEVIDQRLNKLVRRQYTKAPIRWSDLLPPKVGKEDTAEYLVSRTFYRPRDIIEFVNSAIETSVDRADVTVANLRAAEAKYSSLRFRSLGDEWAADYPNLLAFAGLLKQRPASFPITDITQDQLEELLLTTTPSLDDMKSDPLAEWARALYEASALGFAEVRRRTVKVFYSVGLVGLRSAPSSGLSWHFLEKDVLREAEISDNSRITICPMFYRVLGTSSHSLRPHHSADSTNDPTRR